MKILKKGVLVLTIGIILMFLSFFPWDMFLPPWKVMENKDWVVDSGKEIVFQLELLWSDTIHGRIWCNGGNNDVYFLITDSGNNICLNPGRLYGGHRFMWHVPYNGIYSLKFDNTFGDISKDVGYSLASYYYKHVFLIIGAIFVAGGLFLTLKEAAKTAIAGSERDSKQPSPLMVEAESKKLIEGLQKETEDLRSAVKDLQTTIVELLERAREPKNG